MKILGLHIGHNAAAALLDEGRVVAAVQEERLRRTKNAGGIPTAAIKDVFRIAGVAHVDQIDHVAVCGTSVTSMPRDGSEELKAYDRMYERAHRPASIPRAAMARFPQLRRIWQNYHTQRHQSFVKDALLLEGFRPERIEFIDHHTCHAAMAYYGLAEFDEKVLVLTNDGSGDGLCATVNVGVRGRLERLCEISNHHTVAGIYAMITYLLGMTPLEHEYKIMGLAPYGSGAPQADGLYRSLWELFEWDRANPMAWRRRRGVPIGNNLFPFLERLLFRYRFDHIAAAVQRFVEDFLTDWVTRCIKETGISTVCLSGGIFMNVKANQRILALPDVRRLFVVPSCGDESNACGAAYALFGHGRGGPGPTFTLPSLTSIYWGGEFSNDEIDKSIRGFAFRGKTHIEVTDQPGHTAARLLMEKKVVARFAGRMEFGARALGNRSILANASEASVPRFINQAIKSRDFWMPFAPSVIARQSERYLTKPKPMHAPFMIITFDSEPATRDACIAAMHPYDGTLRPQEVDPETNPAYHALLAEYEQMTGHGIILNTSFNLHGKPLVYTPHDALEVFDSSGLEHLIVGNFYLRKQ